MTWQRALTCCGPHLTRYGGHAMAAGLEIQRTEVERFAVRFEEAIEEQQAGHPGERVLWADLRAAADDCDLALHEAMARLAPFGAGNPEPRLLLERVEVAGKARLMGEGSAHLSFAVKQRAGAVRVVGFRRADLHDLVMAGGPLDLLVAPVLNEWRGQRTPELRLIDARAHQPGATPA